jgi:hypothetical protein
LTPSILDRMRLLQPFALPSERGSKHSGIDLPQCHN